VTRAALAAVLGLGLVATTAHADPRFDAFRSACIPYRENYEATWLKAKQDGWVEIAAEDNSELAATIDILRAENDPQSLAIVSPFRKEIAGRPMHLVVASLPQELSLVTSCLLFDFDAGEQVDPSLVGKWLNAAPDAVVGAPGDGSAETWQDVEPLPDAAVKSVFIPDGSPAVAHAGFSGVMLRIDSVGQ
jgi:hypothetical protein